MGTRTRIALLISASLYIAAAAGSPIDGVADSQSAAKPQPAAPGDAAGELLPQVVVTGLRASLEKSLEIKKNADIVLDSINATELGRFPDDDVADSLSHITGISISRTTGGEGQYVGVRGLGSQYNIVTLNNRILATDDDGRDFAFDILPADVISGADVLKSAQASALEGSIGGTVNLRSARPFDDPGFHSAVRAERNYNDMSYFGGSKFSAFASNTSDSGEFGFLLGAVISDTKTRTDALNYNTYDPNNPGVWPLSGPASQPVVGECCISFGSIIDEKKRAALSGTLEWRPSDTFSLAADGMYTRLRDPQVAYNEAFTPTFALDNNGNSEWSNVIVKNGLITSFTANNFVPEIVNNTIDRVVNTSLLGLKATWKPTSKLSLTADLYRSKSDRPEGGNDSFLAAGVGFSAANQGGTLNWTNNYNALPTLGVTLANGQNYATALAAGELGNSAWNPHYVGLSGYTIHDTVTSGTVDGTYRIEAGPLDHLAFGAAQTQRIKSRSDISNSWDSGDCQYCDLYVTPVGQNPITFGSLGANVVSTTTLPNFMQGAGGSFSRILPVFDTAAYLAALRKLNGTPNLQPGVPAGTLYDFALTAPSFNAANSYAVEEKTTALYGEMVFSGSNWSGNVGLRAIHTATTASTSSQDILSFSDPTPNIPTSSPTPNYGPEHPVNADGSYTMFLPSANLSYWIQPALQLRLGAAETMARPELNQLAPTVTDGTENRIYYQYYAGNANLKPIRAYQGDISLEWYYRPKAALTFALFGKKLKDFITTGTTNDAFSVTGYIGANKTPENVQYAIQQPINGDRGYVSGAELGFQHILDNGLGVRAQYTHSWSKAWVQGQFVGQLEGVSPSTASVGVLYETGPISANVSWDYTGSFVAQTFTEVPGWPAISDSFSWVTASASYQLTKEIKVYVEGKNLLDAVAKSFLNGRSDAIWSSGTTGTSSSVGQGYSAYGRTFTAGVSVRF
jgi:iron complex outermembrane recepter protein